MYRELILFCFVCREKDEKEVFKVQDNSEIYHETTKKTWTFNRYWNIELLTT